MDDLLRLHEQQQQLRRKLGCTKSELDIVLLRVGSSQQILDGAKESWSMVHAAVLKGNSERDELNSEVCVGFPSLDI